jgi:tetratricopeptide (TPR) repeat protein
LDDADVPDWAFAEASRLVPQLWTDREQVGSLSEARLYESIVRLLLSFSHGKSVVLIVDDGQWIDEASMAALSYLAHRVTDTSVLLVVAARPNEGGESTLRTVGLEGRGAEEIALGPLTVNDLSAVMADRTDIEDIIERSGGIPLLVAEELESAGPGEASPAVKKYIESRLSSFDGLSSQIASAAAVLHGMCDVDLLRQTSGRTEEEVVDALDILFRDHVLRETLGGLGIGFTLDEMQHTMYGGLAPVRLRLLHARAAQALALIPGTGQDPRLAAAVADHLKKSGNNSEAASWYITAGSLAAGVYAHAEAQAAYQSALAMGSEDTAGIQSGLGDALMMQGRYEPAIEAFQAAAAAGDVSQTASAEHRTGEALMRLGRFDRAEHHFVLAEPNHDAPEVLYSDWALLDFRGGEMAKAAERAQSAVDIASVGDDARAEARTREILGVVTDDIDELKLALELAGDDPQLRMAAMNSLAYSVAAEGDSVRALGLVEEAVRLAGLVGDTHRKAALLSHAADLHHGMGNDEASRQAQKVAVKLFADVQPDAWEPEVWLLSRW